MVMKYCTPENFSFENRIGIMVVPRLGLNVTNSRAQMSRMVSMQTGSAMKNQVPQLILGDMFWSAIMFCGDAMGDAAPPMLAARAMPRINALQKFESDGRFRRSG